MQFPLPLPRRRAIAGAALLLVAVLLGGRYLLSPGEQPPAQALAPPPPLPTSTATTRVVVHVVGAVRRPGLYRFDEGARVADALARAGGSTRRADLAVVNLAAPLADGQQVVVPRRGGTPGTAPSATPAGGATGVPSGPVHLNTATVEQLDELPGVGPVTAQRIGDYREQHGPFGSVDELDAVSGIGPARLEQLRELVAP